MGDKIWLSRHPRKFGNHVTVRPHHRETIEKCPFETTVAACNLRLIDSCQNRGSADQYHMTISRALMSTYLGYVFFEIFR